MNTRKRSKHSFSISPPWAPKLGLATGLALATAMLTGCATIGTGQHQTFQSASMNLTAYGPYERPMFEKGADNTLAAARNRDEFLAEREHRSNERDSARMESRALAAQNERTPRPEREAGSGRSRQHAGGSPPVAVAAAAPAQAQPQTAADSPRRHHTAAQPPSHIQPTASSPSFEPSDAARYVAAVYALNEVKIADSNSPRVVDIYRHAQREGSVYQTSRPAVGDLVFFHNTSDANTDGRPNDWYSHVGIVEYVDDDGTIAVLSYVGTSVTRMMMNLAHPELAEMNGKVINTQLRTPRRDDPAYSEYLAGQLFAGFGSLLGDKSEVTVIDQWTPAGSVESGS